MILGCNNYFGWTQKLTEMRADFGALENGASQGTRLKVRLDFPSFLAMVSGVVKTSSGCRKPK